MFNIPVILLKNLVILPNQEIKLELNNVISGKAINEAEYNFKGEILVIAPIDALEEDPSVDDLPKVGVIARIKNKIDNDGVIDKETITSNFIGYAPSDNPRMSITVVSPNSSRPDTSTDHASLVTLRITKRATDAYFGLNP